jgi:hypothetical protein
MDLILILCLKLSWEDWKRNWNWKVPLGIIDVKVCPTQQE